MKARSEGKTIVEDQDWNRVKYIEKLAVRRRKTLQQVERLAKIGLSLKSDGPRTQRQKRSMKENKKKTSKNEEFSNQ